eukprot:s3321_g5.t1
MLCRFARRRLLIQQGPTSEAQWAHKARGPLLLLLRFRQQLVLAHFFWKGKGLHIGLPVSVRTPKNLFSIQPLVVSCRFTSHFPLSMMTTEDANATSCGESPTTSFYCFVVGRA